MSFCFDLNTILYIAENLRKNRQKIVFTHGTFDLIHPGHIELFHASKKNGDVLIVGVEPDANVRRFKNILRPIMDHKMRLTMVGSTEVVDFAFVIDEYKGTIADSHEPYLDMYSKIKPSTVTHSENWGLKRQLQRQNVPQDNLPFLEIPKEQPVTTTIIIDKIRSQVYKEFEL